MEVVRWQVMGKSDCDILSFDFSLLLLVSSSSEQYNILLDDSI